LKGDEHVYMLTQVIAQKNILLYAVLVAFSLLISYHITERIPDHPPPPPVLQSAYGLIARFDWSMQDRFSLDDKGTNYITNDNDLQKEIDPAYDYYYINFDACSSSTDTSPIVSYLWKIQGNNGLSKTISESSCKITHPALLQQGNYSVTLTVKTQDGRTNAVISNVQVKDLLIISIGDSYASGEGNPDQPQRFDFLGFVKKGPVWQDKRCHRSANAGPAQAALEIERADPHTSVTFKSYACSGATIKQGLIGSYDGTEPPDGPHELLSPQTWQLTRAICSIATSANDPTCLNNGRQVDILMISIGGNDIGFSNIIKACIQIFGCDTSNTIRNNLNSAFSSLPVLYDSLAADIKKRFRVSNILITEYPDPTHNSQGGYCSNILGGIGYAEVKWANQNVLTRLNQAVLDASKKNGWTYVSGIASRYGSHGYCAGDQRWFRTIEDSRNIQGPFCCPWKSTGTMHPNMPGQMVIKDSLVKDMRKLMQQPSHPATPAVPISGGGGGGGGREDCTSFDPVTASVQNIQGSWKVVTGNGIWMLDFGSGPNSQVNAQKAMGIIKQYKFTSQCFIGRPMPAMQYYLVSGGGSGSSNNNNKAPSGTFAGQDCISFNPQTTTVQQIGASWKVVDGTHWIIDFGTSQANANKALSIIKKYDFSQICFVSRPNPPMMYFLSKS
jgi:hypothetical protein